MGLFSELPCQLKIWSTGCLPSLAAISVTNWVTLTHHMPSAYMYYNYLVVRQLKAKSRRGCLAIVTCHSSHKIQNKVRIRRQRKVWANWLIAVVNPVALLCWCFWCVSSVDTDRAGKAVVLITAGAELHLVKSCTMHSVLPAYECWYSWEQVKYSSWIYGRKQEK